MDKDKSTATMPERDTSPLPSEARAASGEGAGVRGAPSRPQPSRLGRGLATLIPPSAGPAGTQTPSEGTREIPIPSIVANTLQPRTDFDAAALDELAQSVRVRGVLQPIVVRPLPGGRYELVAGERRLRAATSAGLATIPAVVREMTDEESLTVALIENIQREDLNAIEAARGYRRLIEQFGLTQSGLARELGKAQPTIANGLRLLRLASEIQESIASGQISEEHGKALLSVADEGLRLDLWRIVVERSLSMAETRKLVLDAGLVTARTARKRRIAEKDVHWSALEDRVRSAFGLKVGIRPTSSGGGTLTIQFADADEIEGILDRLAR